MRAYKDALAHILLNGTDSTDRTGTGTRRVFGMQTRYNLADGFPLLTTKRVFWKGVVEELMFFLSGETNANHLEDKGVNIWREWGDENRNLGPIYSHQWRNFGGRPSNVPQPTPTLPSDLKANTFDVGHSSYRRGEGDNVTHVLWNAWRTMLARCYDRKHDAYEYYGLRGVHVSNDWLVFENFLADVKFLQGWDDKLNHWDEFQLDKDILGNGFCYSKDHCKWASKADNQRAKYRYRHVIQNSNGDVATVENPVVFYGEQNLHQGNFCSMLRGDRPTAQGWSLLKTYDKWAGNDQIANLISQIQLNPDSRRHIVSAWNPGDLHLMALPPCHTLWQVVIMDGKMHLQLYQRSADMFLGVPFNIASYSLLLMMLAHVTGYEAGEFIHTIGDAHIYLNHMDAVQEQLARQPRDLPTVRLYPEVKSIFDFMPEHILLLGYEPHPAIKAPVAV